MTAEHMGVRSPGPPPVEFTYAKVSDDPDVWIDDVAAHAVDDRRMVAGNMVLRSPAPPVRFTYCDEHPDMTEEGFAAMVEEVNSIGLVPVDGEP